MEQPPNRASATAADPKKDTGTHITIIVQNQRENDVVFRIKRDTPLGRLMDAYCERLNLHYGAIRFQYDERRVKDFHTADDLEMEDGDCIDAMSEQLGGSASFRYLA